MNINENTWIEQLELKGDAIEDTNAAREQAEMDAVHEMIADDDELTEEMVDDWYASLTTDALGEEAWSDFWSDKDRSME
tara:strand:+ start:251 stop:487 length:237 start_codon:yes stop_codon:yes gene_type:complete